MSKQKGERFPNTRSKHYDFNSMILAGRPPSTDKFPNEQQFSSKVKEIKALKKFQQLFRKQYLKQDPKVDTKMVKLEDSGNFRKQSPHELCNRLKGMFFLRRKAQMQSRFKPECSDDEYQSEENQHPPVQGVTFSPGKMAKPKQKYREPKQDKSKPLNFITSTTATSGKFLHRTVVHHRPSTQLESSLNIQKMFNSQNFQEIILRANKAKLLGRRPSNFVYFSVYVEQGNNSELIKTAVRKRSGWKVVEMPQVANMVWSQLYRRTLDIKTKKGRQYQRSEEEKLDLSLHNFNNLIVNDIKQRRKRLEKDSDNSPNLISIQEYNRQVEKICPKLEHLHRKATFHITAGTNLCFYNHIPNNHFISDKKNLLRNMRSLYEKRHKNIFEVMPYSLDISQPCSLQKIMAILPPELNPQEFWIIKPGQNSNRGRGIIICKGLQSAILEINSRLIKNNTQNDQPTAINSKQNIEQIKMRRQGQTVILQKYIQPLLYFKRKFDIRMYMLVTNVNKKIRGYVYDQGYIRTSSRAFTMGSFNKYVHLTNDAIQTRSPDYGKFEQGNKVSWKKFQKWMEEEGHYQFWPRYVDDYKGICRNILESVRDSFTKKHFKYYSQHLLPVQKKISIFQMEKSVSMEQNDEISSGQKNKIYFEVFGLDFLIDQSLKTWLIEVNTNPAITTDCSRVVNSLIPRMIDNALAIAVEPFLKNQSSRSDTVKFQNNFQVIYDDEWNH